jgi:hypothetical protein
MRSALAVRDFVRYATRVQMAGDLPRLRRSEVALTGLAPGPMTVAVLGLGAKIGASTLAALLAHFLAAMAPGRVAVLDGDGRQQSQRTLLGTDGSGDLAALLSTPTAWQSRRAIDRYLAHGGTVPLLAPATEQYWSMSPGHTEAAIRLLRHRFPTVVVDAPAVGLELAARVADQVVVIGPRDGSVFEATRWLVANRPGRASGSVLPVIAGAAGPRHAGEPETVFPADVALRQPGTIRLATLDFATQATVEEIVVKLSVAWPNESPT